MDEVVKGANGKALHRTRQAMLDLQPRIDDNPCREGLRWQPTSRYRQALEAGPGITK